METLKVVVVGDGAVGKTSLLINWTTGKFISDCAPNLFDNYSKLVHIDGIQVEALLWDTAGQEEYDRIRPLSYPGADLFIILFSIDSRTSFQNVSCMWLPEIRHHCPDVPFIILGTKIDLRDDEFVIEKLKEYGGPVQYDEGVIMANECKAEWYYECSSKTNRGIITSLETCLQIAIWKKHEEPDACRLC